jgi:hypothetical protein
MEFRVENSAELRVFRRSLPRYAGELDSKLTNASGGSRGENEILMHPKIVSALDGRRADVSLRKAGRHFVRAASERMS